MDEHSHSTKKVSLFEVLDAKTAFWIGVGTAILGLGTLGFIVLGTCMLKGSCSVSGLVSVANTNTVGTNDPGTNTAPVPSGTVPTVTNDDHIKGDKNAKITLIEYSDFQCPFCGAFHPTVNQVLEKYKGKVRLVYRHFPLSFHPNAQPAALASECAAEQGKFWEFHSTMFKNQDALNDAYYTKLAQDNKLNMAKFNDCYKTQKYLKKIQDQAAAGGAAGINGTPGTFVIGKDGSATPITGAVPAATLTAAIDKALGK